MYGISSVDVIGKSPLCSIRTLIWQFWFTLYAKTEFRNFLMINGTILRMAEESHGNPQ